MVEFANHSSYNFEFFWIYTQSGFGRKSYRYITGIKSGVEYRVAVSDKQRNYSKLEIPEVLKRIAICESGGHQFNQDGTIKRGKYNQHDIGKFQINELYWGIEARRYGYDIYTLEGNTQMALHIMRKYGIHQWSWSKKCWGGR